MNLRVTPSSSARSVLASIRSASDSITATQEQLSTGKRVNRPSDAPLDAAHAQRLAVNQTKLDQYATNVDLAQNEIEYAASTIQGLSDLLIQAREACTEGANATSTAADRLNLANSVDRLLQTAVDTANTQYDGRYIFAGTATATQPFETHVGSAGSADSVTYQGNDGRIQIDVGPRARTQTNEPGSAVFGASGTEGSVFDALIRLRDLLRNDAGQSDSQVAKALSNHIGALGVAQDRVLDATARLGWRSNQLDSTRTAIQNAQLSSSQLLSDLQDADVAGAAATLYSQEAALQAAMVVAARMLRSSLLDYLQ
jgi:flagellar hook-associated protein 3 FlgL